MSSLLPSVSAVCRTCTVDVHDVSLRSADVGLKFVEAKYSLVRSNDRRD